MADDYVSRKAVRDRVLSLSLKRFELSDAYKVYVEALKNAGVEIARTPAADVVPGEDFRDCRNELCLKCGSYQYDYKTHECDGCRWKH